MRNVVFFIKIKINQKTAFSETEQNNFPELYHTTFKDTVTFFSSSLVQRKLSLGYATLYRGNTRVNQHYNKDSLNPNTRITTVIVPP